jgi:alkyldihydroxyacetonephosphate synthase
VSTLDPTVADRLRELLGPDAIETSEVGREAYARDLSALGHIGFAARRQDLGAYRVPDLVARPTTVAQVQDVVRLAQELGFNLVPWGAGSGVCGGSVASQGGVILDLKGLERIRRIDTVSQLVEVEAGVNGELLEERLQQEGLTLGHFPSSITCSTVGGWLAARGAGQLSTRYGKVEDMTVAVEVVLPDGSLISTPVAPRAATGPDWNQVFIGSEGVLGVIVACTLRAHPLPARRRFASFEFPLLSDALEAIRVGLQQGARPAAVRLYDPLDTFLVARSSDPEPVAEPEEPPLASQWPLSRFSPRRLVSALSQLLPEAKAMGERALLARPQLLNKLTRRLPGVGCLLVLSFEGEAELVDAEYAVMQRACQRSGGDDRGPGPAETWWRNRLAVSFKQSGVYAMGGFVDTMEVAVSWDRLEALHDAVREALSPHALVMAHFSHAYRDGCSIYFTFAALRGDDPEQTVARYRACWKAGLEAVVAQGACVSHHHGVGSLKGEALRRSHGRLHQLLSQVKVALDPKNRLNPGKLGLP